MSPLSNVHVPSDHMTVLMPRQPLLTEANHPVASQTVPMGSLSTHSNSNPLPQQLSKGVVANPVFQAPPSSPEDVINRHTSKLTDLPYFQASLLKEDSLPVMLLVILIRQWELETDKKETSYSALQWATTTYHVIKIGGLKSLLLFFHLKVRMRVLHLA